MMTPSGPIRRVLTIFLSQRIEFRPLAGNLSETYN